MNLPDPRDGLLLVGVTGSLRSKRGMLAHDLLCRYSERFACLNVPVWCLCPDDDVQDLTVTENSGISYRGDADLHLQRKLGCVSEKIVFGTAQDVVLSSLFLVAGQRVVFRLQRFTEAGMEKMLEKAFDYQISKSRRLFFKKP